MWENLGLQFEKAKMPKTEEERKHNLFFFDLKTNTLKIQILQYREHLSFK